MNKTFKNLVKRKLFLLFALSFGVLFAQNSMELTFDTELSEGTTIALPLRGDVNVTVNWGDNSDPEIITTEGYHLHTYTNEGVYNVTISGDLTWFGTLSTPNESMDEIEQSYADKLIAVTSFGDLGLESLEGAFAKCLNLETVPVTLPASVTSLRRIFYNAKKFNQDINIWDVTNVTDMYCTFESAVIFDQPLNNWNVSNVTNMHGMFQAANAFNNDITNWDVRNVTAMGLMFAHCFVFDQDISNWEVDNVENMRYMFYNNYVFNQDISNWNVDNVTNMRYMFYGAKEFNQSIGSWNVGNVTNMEYMFRGALNFNKPIGNWNVGNVENMAHMFHSAPSFNQDINSWDVSNVTDMSSMFYYEKKPSEKDYEFNQPLNNWDVSNVENMAHMFRGASAFDQDISDWEVGNVTSMFGTFAYATNFNQDISNWDVSNVTNMENMFTNTDKFNQPIGDWDVSNVTNMKGMFAGAKAFNQDITKWDVSNVTNMNSMFRNAIDFSYDISNWAVNNVEDMGHMFFGANSFNHNIGKWNVGAVTNMEYMFYQNETFNQDIGSWNVSNVTNMLNMFAHAHAFDQDLGNWDVSNVSNMGSMFAGTKISTYYYNSILENWSKLTLQNEVTFNGGSSKYSLGAPSGARENIINDFNWTITDGKFSKLPAIAITSIAQSGEEEVSLTADISYSGGTDIIERGIVWSTSPNPTKSDNEGSIIDNNSEDGEYNADITNIQSNVKYYVRAYAENGEGTEYSAQKEFVAQAVLTVTGTFTALDKEYDGTKNAIIDESNLVLNGLEQDDDVEIKTIKTRFSQSKIGSNIDVEVCEVILSGEQSNKYIVLFIDVPNAQADILPKTLHLTGSFTVENKEYDGLEFATIDENNLSLNGVINSDEVEIDEVKISFIQKDPGVDIKVEIYEVLLSGRDSDKYIISLTNAPTATADISQGIGVGIENKVEELFFAYPNPFTDILIFRGLEDSCNIVITDLVGQTIINTMLSDGQTLDVSALTKGVYVVKIKLQNGNIKALKMIKQ